MRFLNFLTAAEKIPELRNRSTYVLLYTDTKVSDISSHLVHAVRR